MSPRIPPALRQPDPLALPLWPLPLVAGLMPAVASLLALWLSSQAGLVPACNPFIEGCTSISRAARHELPNHLFRAIVLPAAALQAVTWVLVARWLRREGESGSLALAVLGVVAASALVLYGSFLGTDGGIYRALRYYGTAAYFGFTCINMLLVGRALERLHARGVMPLPALLRHGLVGLFVLLVSLGVFNAFAGWLLEDPLKDRVQNMSEWWGALMLTGVFMVLTLVWRRAGLVLSVGRQ
jgi:hypothetical protein